MRIVPLGEVCKVVSGSTPKREKAEYWGGIIPWVTPKEINRLASPYLWDSAQKITEEGFNSCSTSMLPAGSVLLSSRAPIGLLAINKIPVCTNQGFKSLVPSSEVNSEYLYYILKANVKVLQARGNGATFKELAKPAVEDFEIPLPPLEDQIRIAHLLGKVEGLTAQRKKHLQQLDDLLKSVFLEMFGDPVRNERGWDTHQFSDLLDDIESGKSPKCEAREATAEEWGVLKLGAVTRCRFDEQENKALPQGVVPSIRDEVKAGDLLFSRKNTYDLVAACAYVFQTRPRLLMPDLIFRFAFKQSVDVNPIFMWKLLTSDSQRKAIQSLAAGAAGSMPNISKTNLKAVRLATPPLPLQNQFAAIVEKVEALKSCYQKSLIDLEALYRALSQQAFKGDLDLSRVALPAVPFERESSVTAVFPAAIASPVINLPEAELLLPALENREQLGPLLRFWLEAYCAQLGNTSFSVENFIVAAQARLVELYPDNDFELGAEAYEHIKSWVFEALSSGHIKQSRNITGREKVSGKPIFGNMLELKVAQA